MIAVWYSVGIFLLLQVVFPEASAAAGHTIDRVISIMDAEGLTLGKLTGFAQRVGPLCIEKVAFQHTSVAGWCSAVRAGSAGCCAAPWA
jgi:hypothetical protein